MTPKDKAIKLVNNFKIGDVVTEKLQVVNINIYSKLFALIAVDEILNAIDWDYYEGSSQTEHNYWKEVKKEIEVL